ncbi:ninjurin-B [Episyrphus balteatus]|uniref:ninjurin-B n=1 Tax=Episyrphus balteatus TaxID=286459 RepID=UPI0024850578|nr:ninjurin-B [Episyrphus balteatus]
MDDIIVDSKEELKVISTDTVDSRKKIRKKRNVTDIEIEENFEENYVTKKNVAEGMMDLALLSANSNQLRFILTYNTESSTFYISLGLIILSLALQVSVGIALILKRKSANKSRVIRTNQFLVAGIFIITFVNVLIAAFTTTGTSDKTDTN